VAEETKKKTPQNARGDKEGYLIAYNEAIRSLDFQRAALDALRTRVGYLLSAATIATSFLGGLALRNADAGVWVGIVLFVVFGALSLRVLWPRAEGAEGFTAQPSQLIEWIESYDPVPTVATLYHDLALYAEDAYQNNEARHVKPLTDYFRAAIIVLLLEIVAWVIDVSV
jgi:hypothetical protein